MTKIVHFGKYYPPDMGGIESVTQTLAEGAFAAGYEVKVVCFDKTKVGNQINSSVQVKRYPIKKMFSSQPLSWAYFIGAVREGRRADIVHLHAPNLLAALASLFIGHRPKLVVHWHSDVVSKGLLGRLVRPMERWMLWRATCILATSQHYADGSKLLKSFVKKVRIVPLGVSTPEFKVETMPLPPRLAQFAGGRRLVLSVGRLTPYKGFSVLVDAAKYFAEDVAIVVAGDGELLESLTKQINLNHLGHKILLAGRVTDEELAALYQNADVFCLPSIERSEAFGVVLLEAMVYSLPIVATNIQGSGVPWVNEHQVSGVNVMPGDAKGLAAACSDILYKPALRAKYACGAKARFDGNFTAEKFCANTLAVYTAMTFPP
ncbi:glycosyltransferase [Glaciimonas sp. GNP009]